MIYAILNETLDQVENIAESYTALSSNWIQIPAGMPVAIGDTYDGCMFYDEEGLMRVTYETNFMQNRIKELEADNILKTEQINTLINRNQLLEDCIAEIASTLYA